VARALRVRVRECCEFYFILIYIHFSHATYQIMARWV